MSAFELLTVAGSLVLVALTLLVWEVHRRGRPVFEAARKIPGTHVYPVVGSLFEGRELRDAGTSFRHALLMGQTFKRGYRFVLLNTLHYWPILAHEVEFIFNSSKHSDKSFFYQFIIPMMGEGLLISNGAKWAHRRKILTPAFHFNILQKFLNIFREESNSFVDKLEANGDNTDSKPEGVEITDLISRLTLNNICETAMGVKLNSTTEPDNYRGMIYRSGDLLLRRYLRPHWFNETVFSWTRTYAELQRCVRVLHEFSGSVIAQRRHAYRSEQINRSATADEDRSSNERDITENIYEKSRYAMLDTLLEAETHGLIDASGIQEEVDTFMFEGYDTTSAGLSFCFFTIGTYPEVQQRLYEEISAMVRDHCAGDSSRLGIHDYSRLPYMDQVIKETFRLFPPVPYITRTTTEPVDLGHVTLPLGTIVHVFIFNLHRDPAQFPDPERFDPDRFLPEATEHRHPFAYVPFSAGTRNCIGQKFAMLEIKALLVQLLLAYRLETVTRREELSFVSDLVLRTEHPIRVRFVKRAKVC